MATNEIFAKALWHYRNLAAVSQERLASAASLDRTYHWAGGGRTTSVSVMGRSGIRKMYEGWLCILTNGGYREFSNKRNDGELIG